MDGKKNNFVVPDRVGRRWGQYRLISSVSQGRYIGSYFGERLSQPSSRYLIEIFPFTLQEKNFTSFVQEGQSLIQLRHPSILRVFDVGTEGMIPFLVRDAMTCMPLRKLYYKGVGQPLAQLLPYLKQAVAALNYAHEQHTLVHKHISPDTLVLGANDKLLLTDFAIDVMDKSEQYLDYQRRRAPIDPIAYLAPEQMHHQASPASDQYALAILTYEWLAGAPPFEGRYIEIAHQQMRSHPAGLRRKNPAIPSDVEDVVMTALAKEADRRFSSIMAFLRALEHTQSSADISRPSSQKNAIQYPPAYPPIVPSTPAPSVAPSFPVTPAPDPLETPLVSPAPVVSVPTQLSTVPVAQPLMPQPPRLSAITPRSQSAQLEAERTSFLPVDTQAKPEPRQPKPGQSSRRAFIISAASVALVAGGGSWLLWNKLHPASLTNTVNSGKDATDSPSTLASGKPMLVYREHTARVNSVAWSPDGRLLASASDDKSVLVSDRTGKTLLRYTGHQDHVNAVEWSPDGRLLASASDDNTVQVWNAQTGVLVYAYTAHTASVNSVAWSSDGRMLASGSDDTTVRAWFATTGVDFLHYEQHSAAVTSVAWSPDMTNIASGSWDTTVQVCSTVSNDAFAVGDIVFSYAAHVAEVYAVAWSPDGTRLASAGGDNVVQVCSGLDGSSVQYPPRRHTKPVRSLAWSPDGKFIASGGDDELAHIWDATTGVGTLTFSGHTNSVLSLDWSPDSALVASASADKTLQLWQP